MVSTLKTMNEEQKKLYRDAVCSVVKNTLFDAPLSISADVDMEVLYSALDEHAILMLTSGIVGLLPLSEDLREKWENRLFQYCAYNVRVQHTESTLLDGLQNNHVDVAVIKGSAAAYYYPQPDDRIRGDIDLIAAPEHFDNAVQALLENGCKASENYHYFKHANFTKNRIAIELHRYFINNDNEDEQSETEIPIDPRNELLYKAIPQARRLTVGKYPSRILPDMVNGIVLLHHIRQHIKKGLGLRQIIDWMLFVDKCLDDDGWNSEFRVLAEASGVDKLAKVVTRMCQLELGLRTDTITWCECDETICQQLMDFVFSSGNFGCSAAYSQSRLKMVSLLKSPGKALKQMQQRGEQNWKLLKKHPKLKCFAWMYQVKKYFAHVIKSKKRLSQLREMNNENLIREQLFEQIGV